YPFRIRAAHLVATFPDVGLNHRRSLFVAAVIHSGVLLAPVVLVWAFARRRASPVVFWGLAATFAWTTASIVAGGGFWDHYLVEAVVPVAIMAGVAAGVRRGWSILLPAVAGAVIVTVALTHWVQGLDDTTSSSGTSIGTAIAAVARPGDTLTNLFGSADATEAAGLSSPYPYLWTLPAQVDDPQLSRLEGLLRGSKAPTWIVDWGRPSFPAPVLQQLRNDVEARYHQVAVICGRTVYLRDGLDRSVPAGRSCRGKDADAGGAVTQTPPAVTTASVAKPAISPMSRP
ncbi:MAG: hypothetical protein JWP74_3683, partial [Marmoricola sp.]|nr:hypothetical protein [Marmoricola sp.]